MERDGSNKSIWQTNDNYETSGIADMSELYDVVIIGGGITGITSALLLQSLGKKCLVVEAHSLGFGTTGGTTAHLNTFFDTPFYKVIKNFGLENAKLLAMGARAAITLIKNNIKFYNIDCDFKELDGYIFTINESQDGELADIVRACGDVGVAANFTNNSPFPIPYLKLAFMGGQAQFNPIKYLFALAKVFEEQGGKIIQNNRVVSIDGDGDELVIKTQKGLIRAKNAIYATHIPPGVNLLHFKCAPYRSYVVAVKLKSGQYPMAMGYDMNDPYHYYRTQNIGDEDYLIVGGEDHKTGHEENTEACFRRLESHVKSYFDVKETAYKWSSQYYESADGLPFIGKLPGSNKRNIYVATGYGGNGMIYGTLAGILLSNIIHNGHSVYQELFDPSRLKLAAGANNLLREGADVIVHFIKDKFSVDKIKGFVELAPGEGRVVKYEGHTLAVYKDDSGEVHILNTVCTHLKCTVGWNASEKSWDCPCHGARFSIDGKVLNGPAQNDLEKINGETMQNAGQENMVNINSS